jgi:hypothetical protein
MGKKLMESENIMFDIWLSSEYWDKPPAAKIFIDDKCVFNQTITKNTHVKFKYRCSFKQPHILKIERSGKTNNQTKFENNFIFDQILNINKIKIDNIDCKNLVEFICEYKPNYPEPWASQQLKNGNKLEQILKGTRILGHNGVWTFKFKSPFYQYLINWIKGNI